MTPPTQAAALLTPAGEELLDRLRGEMITPERAMRLTEELRGRYPAELVAGALTQQSLRMAAREKFSRADEMYFTRAGLEQASAEVIAHHSARRYTGLTAVADLCCGIGGDLIALATAAERVLAVDADLDTLRFARRNVASHAMAAVTFVCADVQKLAPGCLGGVAGVFIDPARRTPGRRMRTGDSQPPLEWCLGLTSQVALVGIKAAPGLAHDVIPAGWEAEFVSLGRALKEALLWSPSLATAQRRATVLPTGDTLVAESGPLVPVADPGEYLLDPNPAVTRARLVQELGRKLGAWQIDPMIAFLSVDMPVRSPFARTLRILDSLPWHEKQAARKLRDLGVGTADIRRRGLAGDVEQIHRRLGLRGDRSATIVLTRREGKPWGLICEDVAVDGHHQPTDPSPR
ncbi:MAG TPA: class I SAM-dependent methyltransferase [Streptosporangiaceae bacterium]|nr:class I SAM-dependent methyltransferase [Streptosporangiaceae bacterium]